jgi:hypothetical protein
MFDQSVGLTCKAISRFSFLERYTLSQIEDAESNPEKKMLSHDLTIVVRPQLTNEPSRLRTLLSFVTPL